LPKNFKLFHQVTNYAVTDKQTKTSEAKGIIGRTETEFSGTDMGGCHFSAVLKTLGTEVTLNGAKVDALAGAKAKHYALVVKFCVVEVFTSRTIDARAH
jgi:hypothetical protein